MFDDRVHLLWHYTLMLGLLMIRLIISPSSNLSNGRINIPLSEKQCSFQYNESYILALMTFSTKNCLLACLRAGRGVDVLVDSFRGLHLLIVVYLCLPLLYKGSVWYGIIDS